MPMQLLPAISVLFIPHPNMHPAITEPSRDFIEAKILQPMAIKLFLDWEKTKGLFVKSTISVVFVILLEQLENVG